MKSLIVSFGSAVIGGSDIVSATRTPCSWWPSLARSSSAVAAWTRNQPSSTHHRPESPPPSMRTWYTPAAMSTNPKMRPARAATTEAFVRSPVNRHTAARSTRPPSSGDAAEQPERDRVDLDAVGARDEGMRQLVDQDGRQEQRRRDKPRSEVQGGVVPRIDGWQPAEGQPGGQEHDNHQGAAVEP